MNTQFLQQKNQNYKFQTPWEHYIIDDFLPKDAFVNFQKLLCETKQGFRKRESDPFDLNFMFLPDLDLAKFFIGSEFQKFLQKQTGTNLEIYDRGLVQLRLMTPDSPEMPPHVDNQNERSLVCIWYVSDWQKGFGGELNLLIDEQAEPMSAACKQIIPKANRLVLFFSDDKNWHSVNRVRDWNRYSVISEWLVVD